MIIALHVEQSVVMYNCGEKTEGSFAWPCKPSLMHIKWQDALSGM